MVLKDTCARTHVGILVGAFAEAPSTPTIFHTMVNWITWSIVNQNRLEPDPKRTAPVEL